MNKVALITTPQGPYSDYILNHVKKYNVDGYYSLIGKNNNYLIRFLRKISFKKNLPIKTLFLGSWKNKLDYYDLIIIIRDPYGEELAKYINHHSDVKVILYFMDPYNKSVFINKGYRHKNCVYSSFEKETCNMYGYIYNPLFCFREHTEKTTDKRDVFFIGTNKGRLKEIIKLEKKFEELGLKSYFHVCKSPGNLYDDEKNYKYKKKITYPELLEYARSSKALLELLPEGQYDMTLRGYEAYFLKKKLITNNVKVTDYAFYEKDNVFILGVDAIENLPDFLNKEYKEHIVPEMEECEFGNWIKKYALL